MTHFVLQKWVGELSLRYQGVLVACIRGSDVSEKHDSSKMINRGLRRAVMNMFDTRELKMPGEFFSATDYEIEKAMLDFLKDHDKYPHHYMMHVIHASEIIGYEHPNLVFRSLFMTFYNRMCHAFHMNPETREQLKTRLESIRVPQGGKAITGDR